MSVGTVGTVAAVLLGAVFLLAGGSKLAAGPAWPAQAQALGAPRPVAAVLPWVELAIGAALVADLVPPAPAVAALALLVAFSVAITRQLRLGHRPVCACFGAWSATPVGAGHLWRNAAFVVLAIVAIAT